MRTQKLSLIFFLMLIYPIISVPFCGVDELQKNTTIEGISLTQKKDKVKKRNLQSSETEEETYHGLETEIIYDYINGLYTLPDSSGKYFENVKIILTRVQEILNRILKLKNDNKIEYYNPNYLCGQSNLKNISIISDADYVLIAQYNNNLSESTIASASYCVYSLLNNNRPIIGRVNININYNFSEYNAIPFYVKVFLHEFFHALGFTKYTWEDSLYGFPLTYKVINGINYTLISSTKVLEMARKHFNCETLEGVPIEGDGGSGTEGSHWDMTFMQADLMVGIGFNDVVISEITLALFEDFGWYKANYYTGGLFKYGKNQGCDFFSKKCIENQIASFNEFCTNANEYSCLKQGYSWGKCIIDSTVECSSVPNFQYLSDDEYITCKLGRYEYNSYCPIVVEIKFTDWELGNHCKYGLHPNTSSFKYTPQLYGDNSVCIEGNLSSLEATYPGQTKWGGCFEIECDKVNKKIKVKVENNEFVCNSTSEQIKDETKYNGLLNCPDYNDFCKSTVFCNDLEDCVYAKSFREDFGLYIDMNILEMTNAPSSKTKILQNDYVNFTFTQNGATFVSSNGLDVNINIRLKYKSDISYINLTPISCYFKSSSDAEMNCKYDLQGKILQDGIYFFQITDYEDRFLEIDDKTVIINEWESQEINFIRNYPLLQSDSLDINICSLNKKKEGIYEFKIEFDTDLSLLTPLPTVYESSAISDPLNCTLFEENKKMLTCLIDLSSKNLFEEKITVNLIVKDFQSSQYNNVINLNYFPKTINITGMTKPYSGCNYLENKIFFLDFNVINADSSDQGTTESLVYFKNINTEKNYYSRQCTLTGANSSITCQFNFSEISSDDLIGVYQIIPQEGITIGNAFILSSFKSELFGLSSTKNVDLCDNQIDFEFYYDEHIVDNYQFYIQFEDNLNDYIPIVTLKDSNQTLKVLNCNIDEQNKKYIHCEIVKSEINISEGETKNFTISIENTCKMTENVDMHISITTIIPEEEEEDENIIMEKKNAFNLNAKFYILEIIFILLFL